MLEKLSDGLKEALRKLSGAGYIDKAVIDELASDIKKTLISSDVDVNLASWVFISQPALLAFAVAC